MNLEDTLLVTHSSCMDGSTCAISFLYAGGDERNIHFVGPSHVHTDELIISLLETTDKNILVADVSISLELAEKLDKRMAPIYILDHHKSAIPLAKFDWCEIETENKRSGGRMLWDYLKKVCRDDKLLMEQLNDLTDLVMAADDHDRWIKNIPDADKLSSLHSVLGQKLFIQRFYKNPHLVFDKCEEYVLDLEEYKKKEYISKKKDEAFFSYVKVDDKEFKIAVVNAGNFQSYLGNDLCSDPKFNVDVAVMVNDKSISFRSSKGCPLDLSKIAASLGGGGHFNASGVSLDVLLGENFTEMVFEKIKWS